MERTQSMLADEFPAGCDRAHANMLKTINLDISPAIPENDIGHRAGRQFECRSGRLNGVGG